MRRLQDLRPGDRHLSRNEERKTADAGLGRLSFGKCLRELVSEDKVFTHMSGLQQTREEYFADVADGSLTYYTIGIADPVIKVDGEKAQITYSSVLTQITYSSVLNADAYGARGTFRMKGMHQYEKRDGAWIIVNS